MYFSGSEMIWGEVCFKCVWDFYALRMLDNI